LWANDSDKAQSLSKEKARLEEIIEPLDEASRTLEESGELLELADAEDESSILEDIAGELDGVEKLAQKLEFARMFSGEADANNAFLDVQAGSGGTEAQDWADMLLRMYLRWCDAHGYKTEILEESDGEEAGIKSVTIRANGVPGSKASGAGKAPLRTWSKASPRKHASSVTCPASHISFCRGSGAAVRPNK